MTRLPRPIKTVTFSLDAAEVDLLGKLRAGRSEKNFIRDLISAEVARQQLEPGATRKKKPKPVTATPDKLVGLELQLPQDAAEKLHDVCGYYRKRPEQIIADLLRERHLEMLVRRRGGR